MTRLIEKKLTLLPLGFTLMEMIITMIILTVIVGLAIPSFVTTLEKFRSEEGKQILIALFGAQKRYSLDNAGAFTIDITDLDLEVRPSSLFNTPVALNGLPGPDFYVAQITRNGSYTLSIDVDGNIECAGGPAGLCSKLGF